jgi:hypothetical protein
MSPPPVSRTPSTIRSTAWIASLSTTQGSVIGAPPARTMDETYCMLQLAVMAWISVRTAAWHCFPVVMRMTGFGMSLRSNCLLTSMLSRPSE